MYLQINMVKYNAGQEITNIYENLQIVWKYDKILIYSLKWKGWINASMAMSNGS